LAAFSVPACGLLDTPVSGNGTVETGGGAVGVGATGAGGRSTGGGSSLGSGAAGNASGGASNAGSTGAQAGGANLDRGPTPPAAGVRFPFPQNRENSRCAYPSNYQNAAVRAAYAKWKADTVTAQGAGGNQRVQRPGDSGLEPNSTVSEGIAYGMIVAVYMNDQPLFDGLWKYEQSWLDENGLMDWYINAAGSERLGTGAATDADEDIAWALVMADKQWGGQGSLDKPYIDIAKGQIDKIWQFEVLDGKLIKPGDTWGDWDRINPSYFAPAYYRVFARVSGNTGWQDVVTTSYDTLENALNASNGNTQNGLVPAWCNSMGAPNPNAFEDPSLPSAPVAPTNYQYDSCRTPFRIGLDFCLFGETRALDYVSKTSAFFNSVGASKIADGYDLNGTPRPQNTGKQSAA
jgi:endo-1,4-beta-D-glucanase Y